MTIELAPYSRDDETAKEQAIARITELAQKPRLVATSIGDFLQRFREAYSEILKLGHTSVHGDLGALVSVTCRLVNAGYDEKYLNEHPLCSDLEYLLRVGLDFKIKPADSLALLKIVFPYHEVDSSYTGFEHDVWREVVQVRVSLDEFPQINAEFHRLTQLKEKFSAHNLELARRVTCACQESVVLQEVQRRKTLLEIQLALLAREEAELTQKISVEVAEALPDDDENERSRLSVKFEETSDFS